MRASFTSTAVMAAVTVLVLGTPVRLEAGEEDGSLRAAAITLARQYDDDYNAKNASGMAALYANDGALVTSGPVIQGHDKLQQYYQGRFDGGATDHHMTVTAVQAQGDGGFGIGEVRVTAPFGPDAKVTPLRGNVVWVYERGAEGWKYRLVVGSLAPAK
jgi:ketosteroid isomerase-like protein